MILIFSVLVVLTVDTASSAEDFPVVLFPEVPLLKLAFAWTIASLASIGSLFYSEISRFVPCTYCWYERIAMYPLVVILGVGLIIKNNQSWLFINDSY